MKTISANGWKKHTAFLSNTYNHAVLAMMLYAASPQIHAQTATWTGGATYKGYSTNSNWTPVGVPLGPSYTVIIPASSSLVYDILSNGVIDALNFDAWSVMKFTNGYGLTVNGPAVVRGQIEAGGPGSGFMAAANTTVLQNNPRLYATNGGQITIGASSYSWDYYNAGYTLLSAVGTNSLVDIKNVYSMSVSYGDGGSWTHHITARSNGVVDLSGLSTLVSPGQDDWLQFNITDGGQIKLDKLRQVSGRTWFNIGVPLMNLPALETASSTYFSLGTNSTLMLTSLVTYASANFILGDNATVQAPKLVSLDGVALTLSNNTAFIATNLTTYRNADILIDPTRNFQPGLLADIYSSRINVKNGSTFKIGATSYDTPGDWRTSPTIFSATGTGSLLDLTSLQNIQVRGGYGGAWNYYVTANSNGVVDLSNLQTAIGADTGYDDNDWLVFTAQNGGELKLDSLKSTWRKVKFNVVSPRFDVPALEATTNAWFYITDGARLNVSNLTTIDNASFTFGFNSTFNAPKLENVVGTSIDVAPGVIYNLPPLTNVYSSLFHVSGGTSVRITAPTYDTYPDWRWNPTLFSADGTGSLIDAREMQVFQMRSGYGQFNYYVTANNNGIIDFSGVQTILGGDANLHNDDWLYFTMQNGGNIRLNSVKQITRHTRFNFQVPQYQFPSLQSVDNSVWTIGDSGKVDAPLLTNFISNTLNLGLNSTFNAPSLADWTGSGISWSLSSTCNVPNLLNFVNNDLVLNPTRAFNAPAFTNIYGSRFSVSGGSIITVAATNYDSYGDWRTSPNLLYADGPGSRLNFGTLKSFRVNGGYGGAWYYNITATNSGIVDLSGLEVAYGADPGYDGDDQLTFNILNNGQILLDSLKQATRRVRFNIQVTNYSLPSLQKVDTTLFALGNDVRLVMTNLNAITNTSFNFGFNNTVDVPQLRSVVDSTLSLGAGTTFNAPPFTNIYASRLYVSGGSVLQVAATNYEIWPDWRTSVNLLNADGSGSLLDLASVQTMTSYGGYGTFVYSVNAVNYGVINLSSLQQAIGPDSSAYYNYPYGSDDWLTYNANSGGAIRLGDVVAIRRVQFNATAAGSKLEFKSLYLNPPSQLSVGGRALMDVKGDFTFANTDPATVVIEGAPLQMDGTLPQELEVGGKNLGPSGASTRNFGISQLIVGDSNQTSIVRLVDNVNNGQRGTSGESEALYLYGLDGQSLRLLNNSRLILNNVPVFALVGGTMRSLNSLVSPGTNSVAFDGGLLANVGGPRITNMVPTITVNPPISSVDVTFDIPIKTTSFGVDDVVITSPVGSVAATSITLVSGNTYRINFAPQTATGNYTVQVGPNVNESAENFIGMDQNSDGFGGNPDDVFTSGFTVDGTPASVISAYALQSGNRVGITFSEPVTSSSATNPANYQVNGTTPTKAVLTNNNQVALWISPVVGETFSLSISNLMDMMNNVTNLLYTGTILSQGSRDVGSVGSDPAAAGSVIPWTPEIFDMIAGGSEMWSSPDRGHIMYEARAGDFDVRVRVARYDYSGYYAKSGIMWRESLNSDSRWVSAVEYPPAAYNRYTAGVRYTTGGSGNEWPVLNSSVQSGVPTPNAWLRLKRAADVFTAYRSTNGVDWVLYGQFTNNISTTGYLCLSGSAYNNAVSGYTTLWYREYSDVSPAIVSQPQSQSVTSGVTVTFGVIAKGMTNLSYQWLSNGIPVIGINSNMLTIANVTTNDVGDYRVVVTNNYGAITSQIATLLVDGIGAAGFEGDVSPTPYGNNSLTVSDWVRVGRLVAGLDSPLNSGEFMRSDCAPRTNATLGTLPLGNGILSVADWTQAGRYAAGLDPITPAGGPNTPGGSGLVARALNPPGTSPSTLSVQSLKVAEGEPFTIAVNLAGAGDENAIGFSLSFNPAVLVFQQAEAVDSTSSLQVNASQAGQGRVGIVLAKSVNQVFPAGTNALVRLKFTAQGSPGIVTVALSDGPVVREVASVNADVLAADYQAGDIRIVKAGRLASQLHAIPGGIELQLTGQAGETYRTEVSTDLVNWQTLSTKVAGEGTLTISDPEANQHKTRYYRAVLQR